MKCAVYARYSSDLQSPTSVEDQVALCQAYAAREGFEVVATYIDSEISGFAAGNRPGYLRLVAELQSRSPAFEAILVEATDRIVRNISETMALYHRLILRRIELIGIKDGIRTGAKGAKLHLAVRGLFNEIFLDDLGEKTHRGMTGRVSRRLSPGGKTFGYRSVPAGDSRLERARRIEPDEAEAQVVLRIFREYVEGRSPKTIAHALNSEGIAHPAKDTRRGPERKGWAKATVDFILQNALYTGRYVWNRTRFVKDPDTGRRRPIPRPHSEWLVEERPELRIVPDELWQAAQERRRQLGERLRGSSPRGLAGGATLSSRYLLSGMLRCGACGARMIGHTLTRRKNGKIHRYGWYRCSFAATKGPTVCSHATWYKQEGIEGALVETIQDAIDEGHLEALCRAVQRHLEALLNSLEPRREALEAEARELRNEAERLVHALASGLESRLVREGLMRKEARLREVEVALSAMAAVSRTSLPEIHPATIRQKLAKLLRLLQEDAPRAKPEIANLLEGDLRLVPKLAPVGEKRAVISGAAKLDGLLGGFPGGRRVLAIDCGGRI